MKKLFIFAMLLLLFSCAQDDLKCAQDANFIEQSALIQDENQITVTDLDNLVNGYCPSKSRAGGYTVSTLVDNNGAPCVYVLNFSQGGWALVSATRKFHPILAHNDVGSFNIYGLMHDGLLMWKNNTIYTISNVDKIVPPDSIEMYKKQWSAISPRTIHEAVSSKPTSRVDHYSDSPFFCSYFTTEDYKRLRGIMADSIANLRGKGYIVETFDNLRSGDLIPGEYGEQGITINDLIAMCDGMTYVHYSENFRFLSFAAYVTEYRTDTYPSQIKTSWAQDGGYNQKFPLKNGALCLAGCAPVAVGQLMRSLQHPTNYKNFDWENMPLNSPTVETSDFLYDLACEMGTTLGPAHSDTKVSTRINFLKKYFTFEEENNVPNSRLANIIGGSLVMVRATFGSSGGHVWLSSGRRAINSRSRCEIYTFTLPDEMTTCGNMQQETIFPQTSSYYMNWGWGGYYDGYYGSSGWSVPGGDASASQVGVLYNFNKK